MTVGNLNMNTLFLGGIHKVFLSIMYYVVIYNKYIAVSRAVIFIRMATETRRFCVLTKLRDEKIQYIYKYIL